MSASRLTRRQVAQAGLAGVAVAALPGALRAATPKDTLVVALAFDDIITMDPGEAFEISAGEIMGNCYDRLIRYDVADPSKLLPDVARSWSLSADGKSYGFEIKPRLKFASGNPLTPDDVAWSLQRAVLLDKTPAFILTQFGFTKDNVRDRIKATGPLALTRCQVRTPRRTMSTPVGWLASWVPSSGYSLPIPHPAAGPVVKWDGINILRFALKRIAQDPSHPIARDDAWQEALEKCLGEEAADLKSLGDRQNKALGGNIVPMGLGDFFFSPGDPLHPDADFDDDDDDEDFDEFDDEKGR